MKVAAGPLVALALLAGMCERALAQASDYPNRPVTFVVPFAPGGVTSLFARILGQKLEQRLGKPFIKGSISARLRPQKPLLHRHFLHFGQPETGHFHVASSTKPYQALSKT